MRIRLFREKAVRITSHPEAFRSAGSTKANFSGGGIFNLKLLVCLLIIISLCQPAHTREFITASKEFLPSFAFSGNDNLKNVYPDQPSSPGLSEPGKAPVSLLESLLEKFLKETGIPGLSVAVFRGDRIIYHAGFGFSDLKNKIPAAPDTLYRIGSITKLLTAATTLKLYEMGLIKLHTPISRYLPDLPEPYRQITIAQLAGHLSGIRHYRPDELYIANVGEYSNLQEALVRFIKDPLVHPPGTAYLYSSYGYVLLGAVLEKVSGKNFNEIVAETLLKPLSLSDTLPERHLRHYERSARFYALTDKGEHREVFAENFSYKWPASGYLSTVLDLGRFAARTVLSNGFLKKSTRELLMKPQKTSAGKETICSFGFRIGRDRWGRKVLYHGGESPGARAFMMIYPDRKLSVIILANLFRAHIFEGEAATVAGFFLGDFRFPRWPIPPGQYEFSTRNPEDGTPVDGLIEIEDDRGTIHGLFDKPLRLSLICLDRDRIRLTAASDRGFINFWLHVDGNGNYSGFWGTALPLTSITMRTRPKNSPHP
ncbi:MAG: serine hydrolase domain-containing protein [Candidatus Saccharicenans sp.]|nr:serine hydrolase domain-containing protein [Candidatus Saccharicenans sp.]